MSDIPGKKKALGRGLSALLDDAENDSSTASPASDISPGGTILVPVDQIEPNPFQPRSSFSETELRELAVSIQEHGIIQPLTVRHTGHNKYQLIAGERRLKASKLAGLTKVPAYVRIANDEQMLEMALVENIQREDLNPIEVAISYQRLLDECRIRQEDLSQKIGKDRSTISNYIRLLKLPGEVQVAIRDGLITMGHARAIITVDDEKTQLLILKKILERKSSVREVEEIVRNLIRGKSTGQALNQELPMKFEQARQSLRSKLQSTVDLKVNAKGAGRIVISFKSDEEFDRIVSKLND
jgi:ParB family chromosome partitioning protein